MDRESFIRNYCERSGRSWNGDLDQFNVALPCACGAEECEGWAMVSTDPRQIAIHNELYAPTNRETATSADRSKQ